VAKSPSKSSFKQRRRRKRKHSSSNSNINSNSNNSNNSNNNNNNNHHNSNNNNYNYTYNIYICGESPCDEAGEAPWKRRKIEVEKQIVKTQIQPIDTADLDNTAMDISPDSSDEDDTISGSFSQKNDAGVGAHAPQQCVVAFHDPTTIELFKDYHEPASGTTTTATSPMKLSIRKNRS
jgi:hypothetical protein